MEVCRSTPQPSSQPLGAASPYRDPAFEFNAPRFFDFQRFDHDISPPSSEGDTYFDTSQVKGELPDKLLYHLTAQSALISPVVKLA